MSSAPAPAPSRCYRVGHTYTDKASPHDPADEFLRWFATNGRTIPNAGGIRPRAFLKKLDTDLPALVVLVTTHVSADFSNPWEDVIDDRAGTILYWGDAKFSERDRPCEAFKGNAALKAIYDHGLVGARKLIPPILHFTKPEVGKVLFNGLCALDSFDLTWYEDSGRPIRNFRWHLSILDEEYVPTDWLRGRMASISPDALDELAPPSWRKYVNGQTRRRQLWKAQIRSAESQLPPAGSPEAAVIDQLRGLPPQQFERVVVALMGEIKLVEHSITQTRYVNDYGFDFFGRFTIPQPIGYEVPFRGEVKRYKARNGMTPGDVSRLDARLRRGEYGLFVTTSYYTRQAQEEVLEDGYPVKLFAAVDLVRMMKELKLVTGDRIRPEWLAAVCGE